LGFGDKMSSAQPAFVSALDGCRVHDLQCGQGNTLIIIKDEDQDDKNAIKKIPEVNPVGIELLEKVIATRK